MRTPFPWVTAGAVVAAWAVFGAPDLSPRLLWDRHALRHGELWRLFTGHWVHFSWTHALADTLVLAISGIWMERRRRSALIALLGVAPLVVSAALFVLSPQTEYYAGLSGVAMAALVCSSVIETQHARRSVAIGILIFAGMKIALELSGVEACGGVLPAGVRVEPISHATGALCGALVACMTLDRPVRQRLPDRLNANQGFD